MNTALRFALYSIASAVFTSPAIAQESRWSIGVTGGTLGVGPQVAFRPSAHFGWFPTGGGLRISLGGRVNNTEIDLVGRPTTSVTVGNATYTPQQIGTLAGTVTTDDFAPMLTIGYGGTLAEGFTL